MNRFVRNYVALCGLYIVLLIVTVPQARAEPLPDGQSRALQSAGDGFFLDSLKKRGIPTDTPEQLKEAAKSKDVAARWSALNVLASRLREGAIPTLKEGLQDSDVRVRRYAALLLGGLGDRSGIPVLRRDLATLVPGNEISDPNMKNLVGPELQHAEHARYQRLSNAINVAEALAEMGDPNGLELSAKMAVEAEYGTCRMIAVRALTDLALLDGSVLSTQRIAPEAVLVTVAASETNPAVQRTLMTQAARLPDDVATKILETLVASPHVSEENRNRCQDRLKWRAEERAMKERPNAATPAQQ